MSLEKCFKGKKVLVTGAGRGIGKGLAERLHEYGAVVYAVSRSPENLDKLKAECPGIITISVDLQDWDATRKALSDLERMDGLICNAGSGRAEHFLKISSESFDQQFNINVKSTVNVCQIIAEKMIAGGQGGSIVLVSSAASRHIVKNLGTYCASKAAVDSFGRTMANELGEFNIRTNVINMGPVDTELYRVHQKKKLELNQIENLSERYPLGKEVIPLDEIVNSTLFLLSDLAPMLTGETLFHDGGYSAT